MNYQNSGPVSAAIFSVVFITSVAVSVAQVPSTADPIALEHEGKFAEAAEAWQALIKANPRDAAAFASLGLDLARQQKYAEAINAYKRAVALNPKLPGLQ